MSPITVSWEGAFLRYHSLALVNRELVLALADRPQISLFLTESEPAQFDPPKGHRLATLRTLMARPTPRHVDIEVRHRWPPRFGRTAADRLVFIQPWEFGSLPASWIEPMNSELDEVWVPTTWVRSCYIRSGVSPSKVRVIPNGVDTQAFNPEVRPFQLPTTKRFVFLFVGGLIHRKGVDILLRAYSTAFRPQDDVCLVIKDYGAQSPYTPSPIKNQVLAACANASLPQIVYLDRDMPDDMMPALYRACNCLVHPYRGEGFGLPIAEAMACGLPVITTNYGAALDFCDTDRCYLIPAQLRYLDSPKVGDLNTTDVPWLAEPDWEALAWTMRRVYEDPAGAEAVGQRAHNYIAAHLTWKQAAERVLTRLEALAG